MRLEQNAAKQDVRDGILEQIKSELKENRVSSYIVSLPASNWKFETKLITTLNCLYPDVKFTLHCFEVDNDTFDENTTGINQANLPFTIETREGYFVSGKCLNVEVIYQYGPLSVDDVKNGCEVRNQRLIIWADYCGYPIDYPEKESAMPMKDLTFLLNNFSDALIYQTNAVSLRHTRMQHGFNFSSGSPAYNSNQILEYYRRNCPSRNRVRRCEVFKYLYKGGVPRDGSAPRTPMFTFGWRTGKKTARHIKQVKQSYAGKELI